MLSSTPVTLPKVVIVILNWNKRELSLECIKALKHLTYSNWQILLVDNGSTDGSMVEFRNLPDDLELISLANNQGYTGGNNVAIRRAMELGADYIWLLNNDAKVEAETLSFLVNHAEKNSLIGLIGPLLMHPGQPATCEAAGVRFNCENASLETTTNSDEAAEWQRQTPERMIVYGTGMLIKRVVIESIGVFDEHFFAYDEDIDLSIRSAKAGFLNVINFQAILWHETRPALPGNPDLVAPHVHYYMARNDIRLWRKHCSRGVALKANYWAINKALKKAGELRRDGRGTDVAEALLCGIWDGLRGKHGPYIQGRRVPEPWRSCMIRVGRMWSKPIH